MNLLSSFNRTGNTAAWNGNMPFVFAYIGDDDPARGDTHGYVGLAKRVADRLDAEFLFLDRQGLEEMYRSDMSCRNQEHDRLLKLFQEKGYPDFIFSRNLPCGIKDEVGRHGNGLIIQSINESIYEELFSARVLFKGYPRDVVPHHISPEMFAWEGESFAREYEDLPRPFIGVTLAGLHYDEFRHLAGKLVELRDAYGQASIFLASCHRTCESNLDEMVKKIREGIGGKFPIVEFNYNAELKRQARADVWNPYIGLISQADHLIVTRGSQSMISEPLATGRMVYTTGCNAYPALIRRGYVKDLFSHRAGTPLKTGTFKPVDITADCADEIIRQHRKHRRQGSSYGVYNQLRDLFSRCPERERESRYRVI